MHGTIIIAYLLFLIRQLCASIGKANLIYTVFIYESNYIIKMKQIPLKAKEINKLVSGIELNKKDSVVLMEDENKKIITVNKEPYLFYYEDKLIPTLKLLQTKDLLKKITVDMGAIKFVVNGADVMRPGITKIDPSIEKNEAIVIVDENNQKPLAIGIALLNAEEMEKATSGKVIKNIHYVGDDIWKLE